MKKLKRLFAGGVRIKPLCVIISVVLIAVLAAIYRVTAGMYDKYYEMLHSVNNYQTCLDAADDILEASDYLTENCRAFAATGKTEYLNNYFDEADNAKRREKALKQIKLIVGDHASEQIAAAIQDSRDLMDTEYYAMKLAVLASGGNLDDCPSVVKSVEISGTDMALSADGKRQRAVNMLYDDDYTSAKTEIRGYVNEYITQTLDETSGRTEKSNSAFLLLFHTHGVLMNVLFVLTIAMVLMFIFLVIVPLRRFEKMVKAGKSVHCGGARELRDFANTYNRMHMTSDKNVRQNVELKKSNITDPLTSVYNRNGYGEITKEINQNHKNLAFAILDIDKFKTINDTYGHPNGDRALQIVAGVLERFFRKSDYIFRLGGDEFGVIVTDVTPDFRSTLQNKFDSVNDELSCYRTFDGTLSVSVGVVFSENGCGQETYDAADAELNKAKNGGRHRCCISDKVIR